MKCDIIKDLLPSYIEGLSSNSSNEEIEKHLDSCKECKNYYKEMTGEIEDPLPAAELKDLDYLKKVRKKNIRSVVITAGIVVAVMLVVVSLVAIAFPVSSTDVEMTYQMTDNKLDIELELKNGRDLFFDSEHKLVYDDNKNFIGVEVRYRLIELFRNPFDDVGSRCSIGTDIQNQDSKDPHSNTLIIEFADKNVTFVNGELVE